MKIIIMLFLTTFFLLGCAEKNDNLVSEENMNTKEIDDKNMESYFYELVQRGNSVFYLADLSYEYRFDATTCEEFILKKNISIQEACQKPISFKNDAFIHGVLEYKKPLAQIAYSDGDNNFFKYNVYSIVLEDGRRYQTINKNKHLPFQKETTIETKYSLIHALKNMIDQKIIESYKFTNSGVVAMSGHNMIIFQNTGLLNLNFLGEYIEPKDYQKAMSLLPSVGITFVDKHEPGYLIPSTEENKSADNSMSLDFTTTNLKGEEAVKTTMLVFRGKGINPQKTPDKITFLDSGYQITTNEENFKKTNRSYILTFSESENDLVRELVRTKMKIKIDFKNEKKIISIKNKEEDIVKMFNGMELINLMNLSPSASFR